MGDLFALPSSDPALELAWRYKERPEDPSEGVEGQVQVLSPSPFEVWMRVLGQLAQAEGRLWPEEQPW
jgi:hypothetical protein